MLFLRSFDIYIKNTIISSYILYMLLNSFNYFPLREINIFPHNNYSFDTHSFLESFLLVTVSRDCRLPSISMVLSSACRVSHVSCRVSRVACCTSDRRYIEHRSSRHSHRASKHLQLRNYALNTGQYYPFDFL